MAKDVIEGIKNSKVAMQFPNHLLCSNYNDESILGGSRSKVVLASCQFRNKLQVLKYV